MRLFLSILIWCLPLSISAQNVLSGSVFFNDINHGETALPLTNIHWLNTFIGVTTDLEGVFSIPRENNETQLIISFVGYNADTVTISDNTPIRVVLSSVKDLNEIKIVEKSESTGISSLSTIKMEQITENELRKAACCNLSESFETNPTVDVNFSDAVTGVKTIKMLGLDGIYTQFLFENLPIMQGLDSKQALEYIPGSWMESIQVSKGAGSVINGFSSMTGQINIELKKPFGEDKLEADVYSNQYGRVEGNLITKKEFSPRLATSLLAHGMTYQNEIDENGDNFLDIPKKNHINLMNRWKYSGTKMEGQFGIWYIQDQFLGGQMNADKNQELIDSNPFSVFGDIERLQIFSKTGRIFENGSLGLQLSGIYFNHEGHYGLMNYSGNQKSLYANLIRNHIIIPSICASNPDMLTLNYGLSLSLNEIEEQIELTNLDRTYNVPGAFGEIAYNYNSDFGIIAGIRADYWDEDQIEIMPRLHARYALNELTSLRYSIGRGSRMPNLFTENSIFQVSGRDYNIALDDITLETSWNTGLSFTHKWQWDKHDFVFTSDVFRTWFTNQVIVDPFENQASVNIYQLDGDSYSNFFQTQLEWSPINALSFRAAYKWNEVKVDYSTFGLQQIPLQATHSGLFNVGFETRNKRLLLDATMQIIGRKNLNLTSTELTEVTMSDSFVKFLGQATYKINQFDFYVGVENASDFTVEDPIYNAETPYATGFDAASVWGPVVGRIMYAGIRYKL